MSLDERRYGSDYEDQGRIVIKSADIDLEIDEDKSDPAFKRQK